jgi:monofunctional biosynthetic peptidoglycan transglycosylase
MEIFKTFVRRVAATFSIGVLALVYIACVVTLGGAVWFFLQIPDLSNVKNELPYSVHYPDGRIETRTLDPHGRGFVRSKNLPKHVVGAILVSEDAGFYQHHGLDWVEIRRAMETNRRRGKYARGASTITQQVVKNAFLSREKTLLRKVIEAITAIRLERILSKEEILDYYLNLIELGPGIYGIQAGSRHYFGKAPENLSAKDAATIAFLIPSPTKYGPAYSKKQPSPFREQRVSAILTNMVRQHYLAQLPSGIHETEEDAILEPPEEPEDEEPRAPQPSLGVFNGSPPQTPPLEDKPIGGTDIQAEPPPATGSFPATPGEESSPPQPAQPLESPTDSAP